MISSRRQAREASWSRILRDFYVIISITSLLSNLAVVEAAAININLHRGGAVAKTMGQRNSNCVRGGRE